MFVLLFGKKCACFGCWSMFSLFSISRFATQRFVADCRTQCDVLGHDPDGCITPCCFVSRSCCRNTEKRQRILWVFFSLCRSKWAEISSFFGCDWLVWALVVFAFKAEVQRIAPAVLRWPLTCTAAITCRKTQPNQTGFMLSSCVTHALLLWFIEKRYFVVEPLLVLWNCECVLLNLWVFFMRAEQIRNMCLDFFSCKCEKKGLLSAEKPLI